MLLSRVRPKVVNYRGRGLECPNDIRASVLLPLFENENDLHIVLTKRTDRMTIHPGEVSFPGGRYEEEDADTIKTALRECYEEIGVKTGDVEILGRLDDMTTLSGLVITPYVGIIPYPYAFKISQKEVAYLIDLPFELLKKSELVREQTEYGGKVEEIDAFYYKGERVWGATCRILMAFKRLLEDDHVQS